MSVRSHDPNTIAVHFEQFIFPVIPFSALFANRTKTCSASTAPITLVFAKYWCIGCWLWTCHCFGYFFPALFANQLLICFMSVVNVSLIPLPLHLQWSGWLWTVPFSDFVVSGSLLTRHWFVQRQQHLCIRFSWGVTLVQWLLALNKSLIQYVYFLTWVLYNYIIFR